MTTSTMIREILDYLKKHPDSSFPDLKKGLGVPVTDFKDDFYNLKNDKYLSQKTIHGQDSNGNLKSYHVFRVSPKGLELLLNLSKTENLENKENTLKSDSKKVFISHAYNDKKIADRIINKLVLPNLNIEKEDIFYTSKRETGIGISQNWRNTIKHNIIQCKIYIALITSNFQKSEMCLNELGAAWVLNKTIYPIILPPVKLDNFSLLISDLQALIISNPIDIRSFLNSLQIDLEKLYNIGPRTDTDLEKEIIKYGKSLRQFLRKNPSHFKIPSSPKNDRKSDLKISPHIGDPDDESFKGLNLKFIDISIENTSNKSIEFDIEMKVHKNPDCKIILQKDLKELIKKQQQKPRGPFDYGLIDIRTPSFDFDVHSKEFKDYILVSRIKLRNQKTAVRLSQQDIEVDVFNKNVLIIKKGATKIKAEITIRSDDFTEGILFRTIEI
jgi:hypothetical protein